MHRYVLQYATCPVEWLQIAPLLAWQDYMATGQPDLALAFTDALVARTMVQFLEPSSGLLRTDAMAPSVERGV